VIEKEGEGERIGSRKRGRGAAGRREEEKKLTAACACARGVGLARGIAQRRKQLLWPGCCFHVEPIIIKKKNEKKSAEHTLKI